MDNKITSLVQIVAAIHVQRRWRRFVARKKFAQGRQLKAVNTDKEYQESYLRAVLMVQRMWRRFLARRGELERLMRR